jgi:hypothetical protein
VRVRRCNIIALNAHAPTKEKSDASNDFSYEGKEQVLDNFSKNHMKIVLDFNVKFGREDIFKPTIRNESLHKDSNDNCVRTVTFATSTSLVFKRVGCSAPKIS